jgi:hypothetical protein
MAAIATAGLTLHHAGGHQIMDVTRRATAADHVVGEAEWLLEVAGRSRRVDLESAWSVRWERLTEQFGRGFFVFVAEFESPQARFGFAE